MKNINTLCKIKRHFPKNYLFFVVFLFSKMYSSVIISIVTKYNSNRNLFLDFFTFFTFFSLRLLKQKYFSLMYEIICFFIYIYTIIIITFIVVLLINKGEENKNLINLPSKSKQSKRRFISFVSILSTITVLLSQYLIEILSLPICLIIIQTSDHSILDPQLIQFYQDFIGTLNVSYYFYLVINVIIMILLNLFAVFYLKLLNNVTLSNKKIISFMPSNSSVIILVFTQNMQIVHYYLYLFKNTTLCILNLNFVSLVYYCFAIGVFISQVTYLEFCNIAILFSYLFCFYGSIISIIYNFYKDTNLSMNQIYFQLVFQLILASLSISILYFFKTHMLQMKLPLVLFKYNRSFKYIYISQFILFIKGSFSHIDKISYLLSFILTHQESCTNSECDCASINITELRAFIRGSKIERKVVKSYNNKSLLDIILIIENILMNHINALAQNKLLLKHIHLIVYHCNYVFYFKRNYTYSLYIIDEYISQLPSMPFEYKVHLYAFKKKVVKSFNKKTKRAVYDGSYIFKCKKFALYYNHLIIIRKKIEDGCKFYSKILNLKRLLYDCKDKSNDTNSSYHSHLSSYIKLLFANCNEFNICLKEIEQTLLQYYSDNDNEPLYNNEICYLITNFFAITNKDIPIKIIETFVPTESYYQFNKIVSYYSEVQFIHPIILSIRSVSSEILNTDNTKESNGLFVEYISQQMLDILGYKKCEIIGQEIKKLIPQFFSEKQTNIIQSHFFIQKKIEIELLLLLITKQNYFKRALGVIGSFPTLMNHVVLICNIDILDNDISYNRFRFVLDVDGKIITFTENFAKKYWLTYQMINKLDISFTSLFGISMNKLCSEFKQTITQIKESDSLLIEKYTNILSSCKLSEFLSVYTHKIPTDLIKEKEDKTYIATKNKIEIKRLVYCIRKQVEEKEVDTNWLNRLKSLESSLISENIQGSALNFEIMLQHIGNIPYFIAVVTDYCCIDHSTIQSSMKRRELLTSEKNLKKLNFFQDLKLPSRKISAYKNDSNQIYDGLNKNSSYSMETMDGILANQSSTLLSLKEIKLVYSLKSNRRKMKSTPTSHIRQEEKYLLLKAQKIVIAMHDKLLFAFLEIIAFTIIAIHIVQIILQQNHFVFLEEISLLGFDGIYFKEMYYDTANYYSSLCFRLDNLEPSDAFNIQSTNEELVEKLINSSSNLLSFLNQLIKTINNLGNYREGQELFDMIYEMIPFKKLNRDWSKEEYNSSLEYEISMIHYHIGVLRKGYPEICRIREIFIDNPIITSKQIKIHISHLAENEDDATVEEILFFGFLMNSMKQISKKIDSFIVKATSFQRGVRLNASATINRFNIVSIILMIVEFIVFTLLIFSFKRKLIQLLYIFIMKTPRIIYQEMKIAAFSKVISSFDEETCNLFENVVYTSGETEKNIIQLDAKAKVNTSTALYDQKDRKSLNNNTKLKVNEEDEPRLNNHSLNTSIQLISINFVIVFVFIIIYLIVSFGGLTKHIKSLEGLKLTHEIGNIYLSSIPSFSQIILYYKQSIIVNDYNFDTIEFSDYELYDYSKSEYFTSQSKIEQDSRYDDMGISSIAFFFKKFYEEIQIMKRYNQNSELKILPLSRNFQYALSCDELVSSFKSLFKYNTTNKLVQVVDKLKRNCNEIADGLMNKGGLQLNLEKSVESLFNLYLEFIRTKNISKNGLEKLLLHDDYILAVYENQNIFVYLFYSMSRFITQDTINFFIQLHQVNLFYVILSTFVTLTIIFTFIFILYPKMLCFFNSFKDIVQRMEISLLGDKHFTV